MKIDVLGTKYTLIESTESVDATLVGKDGYCDTSIKKLVVEKMTAAQNSPNSKKNLVEYKKTVKRHEIIHAFLHESGLDTCSWAANEEMVDWIAIQFPKMLKAFTDGDCI